MSGEAMQEYDIQLDIEELGLHGIANRAVFIVNDAGDVVYDWVAEEPSNDPDYDELLDTVQAA
jgi:hypothetical protein